MNKLSEIINSLNYEDLRMIEKDIEEGNVSKIVRKRIEQYERSSKTCPVCYKEIVEGNEAFTLIFGSPDFKKKASFCALDCLEFFISKIKNKEIKQ